MVQNSVRRSSIMILFLGLAFVFCWARSASAAWNTVALPVEAVQAQPSLDQWQTAFEEALVRCSGNAYVMSIPALKTERASAAQFAVRYRYAAQPPSSRTPYLLSITFNAKALAQLLSSAGQALWGPDRAETLVFLRQKTASGFTQLDGAQYAAGLKAMRQQAAWRGLPMVFPLGDLQDQSEQAAWDQALDADAAMPDVAASPNLSVGMPLSLHTAAPAAWMARYGAGAFVSGVVTDHASSSVQIDWTLWFRGARYAWTTQAATLSHALTQGVDGVTDRMVSQSAALPVAHKLQTLTLWLGDVDSLQAYAQAVHYLNSLDVVDAVDVGDLTGDGMLIKIKTRVASGSLATRLNEHRQWTALPEGEGPGRPFADLYYTLAPPTHAIPRAHAHAEPGTA